MVLVEKAAAARACGHGRTYRRIARHPGGSRAASNSNPIEYASGSHPEPGTDAVGARKTAIGRPSSPRQPSGGSSTRKNLNRAPSGGCRFRLVRLTDLLKVLASIQRSVMRHPCTDFLRAALFVALKTHDFMIKTRWSELTACRFTFTLPATLVRRDLDRFRPLIRLFNQNAGPR